jgi:hypothetical protein
VPLDAKSQEVEAFVNVGDLRLALRQAQAHRNQHRGHLGSQRLGVRLGSRHQHHEVVREADEAVGGEPVGATPKALIPGRAHRLPRPGEVLVQVGQGDVGQQR